MNLLDTASLVVTPNGYKASKLYSIIPSDGTGDMTFARTGDTATRVNSSGLIETVLANKPRLDYLGSTCPKLLLEPQRTNLSLDSADLTTANWGKNNVTVTANSIASPDGGTNADLVTGNAGTATKYVNSIVSAGGAYTFSCFVKKGTQEFIQVLDGGDFQHYANFNLTLGTIGNYGTKTTAKIELYNNSWYRISCYFNGAGSSSRIYLVDSLTSAYNAGTSSTGTIYVWGAQSEAGAYATSYIATTTASVTRIADSCLKTGISSLIGQTEGTLFIQYNSSAINVDGRILALSNGAFNNRIVIAEDTGRIRVVIYTSNTLQVDLGYSSNLGSYTGNHKIAVSYANNYLIVYVDGVLKASVNTLTVPACNSIYIGNLEDGTNITSINGRVSSVALWKTRLQNSELATLTSL